MSSDPFCDSFDSHHCLYWTHYSWSFLIRHAPGSLFLPAAASGGVHLSLFPEFYSTELTPDTHLSVFVEPYAGIPSLQLLDLKQNQTAHTAIRGSAGMQFWDQGVLHTIDSQLALSIVFIECSQVALAGLVRNQENHWAWSLWLQPQSPVVILQPNFKIISSLLTTKLVDTTD